jgi:DNA-binding NarL/FixJ family response regulator
MERIRVLCVDDNAFVADGIRIRLGIHSGFEWVGHLPSADDLIRQVQALQPHIVLLDIDMPGRDSLEALEELTRRVPSARTVIVSGYERDDYLDRAIDAGAWGYVSKNDGPQQIVEAIHEVHAGRFAFGPSMMRYCAAAGPDGSEPADDRRASLALGGTGDG